MSNDVEKTIIILEQVLSRLEKEIRKIEKEFYQSREALLFKLKNVDNEFSIKIGKLDEWKNLQRSIASTGIVLYGNYQATKLPNDVKCKAKTIG